MSTMIKGTELREITLGRIASKSVALSAATIPIFTIAGGRVLVTGFWATPTVAITATGGTLALQNNPTTGTTSTIVTATDLGTTDTAIGDTIGIAFQSDSTTDFAVGGKLLRDTIAQTGQLELVGASAINGTVTCYATWIPLDAGATLVAA